MSDEHPIMLSGADVIPDIPNADALRAIYDHYCMQRDPRETAKVIAEVMKESARRLFEGHLLHGDSLEGEIVYVALNMKSTRQELIASAVSLLELAVRCPDGSIDDNAGSSTADVRETKEPELLR